MEHKTHCVQGRSFEQEVEQELVQATSKLNDAVGDMMPSRYKQRSSVGINSNRGQECGVRYVQQWTLIRTEMLITPLYELFSISTQKYYPRLEYNIRHATALFTDLPLKEQIITQKKKC